MRIISGKRMLALCMIALILGYQPAEIASAVAAECGGSCHGTVGFPEDEPFLREAAAYAHAHGQWLKTKRDAEAALARGGQMSEYADRIQAGAASLNQAAGLYAGALHLYLSQLQARGVSVIRFQWLERLHGLYIP